MEFKGAYNIGNHTSHRKGNNLPKGKIEARPFFTQSQLQKDAFAGVLKSQLAQHGEIVIDGGFAAKRCTKTGRCIAQFKGRTRRFNTTTGALRQLKEWEREERWASVSLAKVRKIG